MRRALEITNGIVTGERQGFLILISDGLATDGMHICDGTTRTEVVQQLYDKGMKIQPVIVDVDTANPHAFDCLEASPIILQNIEMTDLYFTSDCLQTVTFSSL